MKRALFKLIAAQFRRPHGLLGALAGWIMGRRSSNRARTAATIDKLGLVAGQRLLEIGFGPGLGLARAAQLGAQVVGLEHSTTMIRQATARNAAQVADGSIQLIEGDAQALPEDLGRFDRIVGINVHMFWSDPEATIRDLVAHLHPRGRLALTLQPRAPGSDDDAVKRAESTLVQLMEGAGLSPVRASRIELQPVDAVCVIGERPDLPSLDPQRPTTTPRS
jgi:SAM-dependent methyltransferase